MPTGGQGLVGVVEGCGRLVVCVGVVWSSFVVRPGEYLSETPAARHPCSESQSQGNSSLDSHNRLPRVPIVGLGGKGAWVAGGSSGEAPEHLVTLWPCEYLGGTTPSHHPCSDTK